MDGLYPRIAFFILLSVLTSCVICEKILLLGDSVDRMIVDDWCSLKNNQGHNTTKKRWDKRTLLYRNIAGRLGSAICQTENDSIAFVHLFGSDATGPYANLKTFGDGHNDPYEGTQSRLNHSITMYQSQFGSPDRIIWHSGMWDSHGIILASNGNINYSLETETFHRNTVARVDDIIRAANKDVKVGLRTGAWCKRSGKLLHMFNAIIRNISLSKNLTLFDFDDDMWSSANYDYEQEKYMFRDAVHPNHVYLQRAGEKLLGLQYSNSMIFRYGGEVSQYYEDRFDALSRITTVYLWYDILREKYIFLDNFRNIRHEHVDEHFMSYLRLGPRDVRHFNGTFFYDKTTLGDPVPKFLFDDHHFLSVTGIFIKESQRNRID